MDILQRLEELARQHPGAIYRIRGWFAPAATEMHFIIEFLTGAEQWSAVGNNIESAYCELRRKMVIGE